MSVRVLLGNLHSILFWIFLLRVVVCFVFVWYTIGIVVK